jgi:hypothetical protein
MRRRFALGAQQQILQVVAVQGARQEVLAIDVRQPTLRKTQKLQRIARIGRRAGRGYVEKIRIFVRGIRHAAAHDAAALDEHDVGAARRRPPQKIGGKHRAGESRPYDYEGFSHTLESLPSEDG